MTQRAPLTEVARELASQRGTSIMVIELRFLNGGDFVCEDASTLREADGPRAVLRARVLALRAVLAFAEREAAEFGG